MIRYFTKECVHTGCPLTVSIAVPLMIKGTVVNACFAAALKWFYRPTPPPFSAKWGWAEGDDSPTAVWKNSLSNNSWSLRGGEKYYRPHFRGTEHFNPKKVEEASIWEDGFATCVLHLLLV